jgi:hypothetical protein
MSDHRRPERIRVPLPQFLGEQDGFAEQELKRKLIELFSRLPMVTIAYLVRVKTEMQNLYTWRSAFEASLARMACLHSESATSSLRFSVATSTWT